MREAARHIGVPESTYREWEYGRKIRGEPYLQIAKAFGVSLDELLGDGRNDSTVEQRLSRAKADIEFVQLQLKKSSKWLIITWRRSAYASNALEQNQNSPSVYQPVEDQTVIAFHSNV